MHHHDNTDICLIASFDLFHTHMHSSWQFEKQVVQLFSWIPQDPGQCDKGFYGSSFKTKLLSKCKTNPSGDVECSGLV